MKARGIFNWPAGERRSDRYGMIGVYDANYDGTARCKPSFDVAALRAMAGQRATISATVVETRDSGHIGDLFRGIYPSRPQVGQVFDLGVGELLIDSIEGQTVFGLSPDDGRDVDWFDPHTLYQLHDQTVELEIKPSELNRN
jgi:hypothetical protein